MSAATTRLAPSPTGALHLGNVRTFVINWVMARQRGWRIVLRIDDLDGPRIKQHAAKQAMELLDWLGLDWDEGPYYQTQTVDRYRAALESLGHAGKIYPCRCTRSQIEAAIAAQSAPNEGDHELRYPGTCRPPAKQTNRFDPTWLDDPECTWRFRVPDIAVDVHDRFAGTQTINVTDSVGDFHVATRQCAASYQLAVVIDDSSQGVTHVARGDDLLPSAARQQLLYDALGLRPLPEYFHLPLVVGPDGRRLAKRHGDTRVVSYRQRGVSPERILGLVGYWSGLGERRSLSLDAWVEQFRLEQLPRERIVFQPDDDQWLCV